MEEDITQHQDLVVEDNSATENQPHYRISRMAYNLRSHPEFSTGLGVGLFAAGLAVAYVGIYDCGIVENHAQIAKIEAGSGLGTAAIGTYLLSVAGFGFGIKKRHEQNMATAKDNDLDT